MMQALKYDLMTGAPSINGIRVFRDEHLPTDTVADWSGVRSPSRAARRLRMGHHQNIRFHQVARPVVYYLLRENALFMHPQTFARFDAALRRRTPADDFWLSVQLALEEIGAKLGIRP